MDYGREVKFGVYTSSGEHRDIYIAVRGMPEPDDREVAVRCESLDVAVTLCERAAHAVVLPELGWASLVRVADVRETAPLYVLHRPPLPSGSHDVRCATFTERLAAVLGPT